MTASGPATIQSSDPALSALTIKEPLEATVDTFIIIIHARQAEDKTPFPRGETWLDTCLVPLRNEAGEVRAVLGIARDITERKRTEQFREEYTHAIAHDLRAPLTAIQGHA